MACTVAGGSTAAGPVMGGSIIAGAMTGGLDGTNERVGRGGNKPTTRQLRRPKGWWVRRYWPREGQSVVGVYSRIWYRQPDEDRVTGDG
uniref:Uncharacterized protein n=1 Tax=Oryza meridionalis TaxID=40149 RepID=A0A0E0C3L5_9ORYZ